MAIRLKIPTGRQTGQPGRGWSFHDPLLRAALVVFLVLITVGGGFFTYYYVKFGRMIDQRFKGPVFGNSARIYAVARPVQVGEKIEANEHGNHSSMLLRGDRLIFFANDQVFVFDKKSGKVTATQAKVRVRFEYAYAPEPGSAEARLAEYLKPRDWLAR